MTIDIISYTDEQFALLTEEQILEIEEAQLRKNRLVEQLEEDKRREKYRLLEAGVFRSPVWEEVCGALEASCQQEVDNIRDGLLFYLRFASRPESGEPPPYDVDYSLTFEERVRPSSRPITTARMRTRPGGSRPFARTKRQKIISGNCMRGCTNCMRPRRRRLKSVGQGRGAGKKFPAFPTENPRDGSAELLRRPALFTRGSRTGYTLECGGQRRKGRRSAPLQGDFGGGSPEKGRREHAGVTFSAQNTLQEKVFVV